MKISILCENTASDIWFLAEWGLSIYIETQDTNILFDTGYSDVYIKNANTLWIDLNKTDCVVLSHFHDDHARWIQFHNFKNKKKVIIHPDIIKKLPKSEYLNIVNDFEFIQSKNSFEFAQNIIYLWEIPRTIDFEKWKYLNDTMLDDSAIAIKTNKWTVLITGCAHSGICNICEYAKKITNQNIYCVLWWFHLFQDDNIDLKQTLDYIHSQSINKLYPLHCIDFQTINQLYNQLKIVKISAWDQIIL